MNLSRIGLTTSNVNAVPVVACGQGTMSHPSPARLTAPQDLHPSDTLGRRSLDIDLSQSLTEILANLPRLNKDSQAGMNVISSCTNSWMAAMKASHNKYEEQLEKLQDSVVTLNITMQGAKSMYLKLQGSVEDLKSNSSEVWQTLESDERRLDKLDRMISRVEDSIVRE